MLQQQQHRLADAFRHRLGGFVREALGDPNIIEVMVNDSGRVWLDTLDRGRIARSLSRSYRLGR
jgi:Flp pilus assembly CpaF family ATPase